MGSFWGQGLHLQSFNFDFPVNMVRHGALQHASRVGGLVGRQRQYPMSPLIRGPLDRKHAGAKLDISVNDKPDV